MNTTIETRKKEGGFTLVELAIVMIIIGLLIGGILKGQELIANARVAATVAQVKAIDAATTTFRDKYDAFPGDMLTASVRLPATGCGGAACANGTGNNRLESAPTAAPTGDAIIMFQHLSAADLLGGINFATPAAWGGIYPAAEIGGGFIPGYHDGTVALLGAAAGTVPAGHYLGLVSTAGAAGADDAINPNQAQRIDTKLDDGRNNTGSVVGSGGACVAAGLYNESNQGVVCDMAIRFQN